MRKTCVLAILDGWGLGEKNESNPIYLVGPKTIKFIENNFPAAALQASGIAVGLPWEEEGSSEVGHLTLGAGKVIYQHFPRISITIEDGSFFKNPALIKAFRHAKEKKTGVHLIGLLTEGNVHASFKHFAALVEMAKKEKCEKLFLHFFTDGRDSPPHSFLTLFEKAEKEIQKQGVGIIVSIAGRYFAMDRDGHWDRTEKAYQILVGEGARGEALEAAKKTYEKGLDDEFIEPVNLAAAPIKDGDAIIFFNFREDSVRQLTEPFLNPAFSKFPTKSFKNLYLTTMTEYQKQFKTAVAFPNEKIENPLGRVLADHGKTQLRVAETEKYAHVTYFFNGLRDKPYPNEYRVLVPSEDAIRKDEHPAMMARAVTDRTIIALNEGSFDFILVNYANPDVVAHTGNYEATKEAIKVVDEELDRLVKTVLSGGHAMIITADHGNAESLLDLKTGEPGTSHDPNPVPIYLIAKEFQKKSPKPETGPLRLETIGILSDVAPTILELMNLPKPKEMTGESLLNQLI